MKSKIFASHFFVLARRSMSLQRILPDIINDSQSLRKLFPTTPEKCLNQIFAYYQALHNLETTFKQDGTLQKMLEDAEKLFDDQRISECRMAMYIIMDLALKTSLFSNAELGRAYLLFGRVKEWGSIEEKSTASDEFDRALKLDPNLKSYLYSEDLRESVLRPMREANLISPQDFEAQNTKKN